MDVHVASLVVSRLLEGAQPQPPACRQTGRKPLKGFGRGLATIATERTLESSIAPALAEKHRRDEEAAAASRAATSTTG